MSQCFLAFCFTYKDNRLYSFFLSCCTQWLFLSLSSLKVNYRVYWNCSQCYHHIVGSTTTFKTKYTYRGRQSDSTYVFSVHAETKHGSGKNATVTVELGGNYGKVKDLTATVGSDYTITVQWKPPPNIEPKEITVCNIFIGVEVLRNSTKGPAILVN